jgi:3-oxoacyl-[acyl-carrier protein] reductase
MSLLEGKKAIITGGARGIGLEIVLRFLREGATVYFIDLNPSESLADMEKAAGVGGGKVFFKQSNVAIEEKIVPVIEEILSDAGTIDILVNNAGITDNNLVFRMTLENWNRVMSINLASAFLVSKVVGRHMAKNKSGSIVNMASVVGIGGNAGQASYAASKARLIGLTRSLAKELGMRGVRVNAVAPGFIDTEMTRELPESVREAFLTQIAMKRPDTPEEVAKVMTFLASEQSSYVSGAVLRIDGCMAI